MKNHIGPLACLTLFVCLTLAVTAARAQVTQTGSVYQFHIKARPGMKINYVIITNGTSPAAGQQTTKTFASTTPVTGVVTSVENKVATFKINYGPQVVNGHPQGEARTFDIKVDDKGKPIGAPAAGLEGVMGNLPDNPIKVGDSYGTKQNINFLGVPFSVNLRYKFLGLKTTNGQRCANFTFTITSSGSLPAQGTTAPFTIQGNGTLLIAVADGMTIHSGGDLNVIVAQGGKLKVATTIQRR